MVQEVKAWEQTQAHERTSDKYTFIPTTDVITSLEKHDWKPVSAKQQRSTKYKGFQPHVIRFRHPEISNREVMKTGDSCLELIFANSHCAVSSAQFHAGVFRMVCSNGMVVCDSLMAKLSVRHIGVVADEVIGAIENYVKDMPKVIEAMDAYRTRILEPNERLDFARIALQMRWGDEAPVTAERVLTPRRTADTGTDLWTTFNTVQENLIKGGIGYRKLVDANRTKRMSTRKIGSPGVQLKLNKNLWELAEYYRSN